MANRAENGFKFVRGINGSRDTPEPEQWPIASGYQGAIQGGGNVDVNVGDLVKRLSTGYLSIAEGTEITSYNPGTVNADIPVGVVVGFSPYFDGTVMQPTSVLPGGTVYGTNFTRQSFALVVPIQSGIWSINVDENTTATTYAAYLALVGQRVDFVNTNATATEAGPRIDISGHATTVTHRFTIYGLSPSQNDLDYSAVDMSILVTANGYADAPNTVGV